MLLQQITVTACRLYLEYKLRIKRLESRNKSHQKIYNLDIKKYSEELTYLYVISLFRNKQKISGKFCRLYQ